MEKLKGFHGIRPGTVEDFTPPIYDEMPESERPVFSLLALTVSENQNFYDEYFELQGGGDSARLVMAKGKRAEAMKALVLPKIKAVKNWPVAVEDADFWESMDTTLRAILYRRILNGADVSQEESTSVKS